MWILSQSYVFHHQNLYVVHHNGRIKVTAVSVTLKDLKVFSLTEDISEKGSYFC